MAPTGARSEAAGGVTDAQGVEDDAAERLRLGRRRYRRYANERLLRALAGPLDADDFAALFLPPPFGNEPVPSAFSEAANALAAGRRADASLGGEEGAKKPWIKRIETNIVVEESDQEIHLFLDRPG